MKKILLCLAVMSISFLVNGQLKIDNATFYISAGATVTVQGDVTSNVDIQGPGLLQLKGSTLQNVNMGGFTIPNLEIDNTSNVNLTANAMIGTSLSFINGKLILNTSDLRLDATIASITGSSSSRYIVTNGTGRLMKRSLGASAFVFPVGYSVTEFNPLTIANSGTVDTIGVRCLQNVLDQGLTGSPVTADFANNSWVVTEATANGSNLALTGEWTGSDELSNFNRIKSGIARYNTGTDWDLPSSNVIAASGSGPYNRSRTGITSTGVFAIADLEKVNAARLNLKVFLQGAYNTGTGLMRDALRTGNIIPLTQPYSASMNAIFTRVGVYDGSPSVNETVPGTAVFDAAGTNDDIVDWIYVSLQDGADPAIKLQTRAALIQRDGDIVEYDAGSGTFIPLRMPINADANYYLIVSHRNHLSVRLAASQLLQDNIVFNYDYTNAQAKAYQNTTAIPPLQNPAMKDLNGGIVFGLWAGNANSNTAVRTSGALGINDYLYLINSQLGGSAGTVLGTVLAPVYNSADLNMDGIVRASGALAINDYLFLINSVLGGSAGTVYTQH
ncbi:MAG TPA: hypothetical protein VIZ28_10545 [Chitinophagaceae bacterium]